MIGAPLGLINFNGALQVTARRGDVAEEHVRFSEVPSRLGNVYIFRTKVALEDRKRPLEQLKRFWRISKVAMRVSKTSERICHIRVFAAVRSLLDRERALEKLARLGGVAEFNVP